jgi:hypothetical protein
MSGYDEDDDVHVVETMQAPVAQQPGPAEHLSKAMFSRPNKLTFAVTFHRTLNELAKNPKAATWSIPPKFIEKIKHNIAEKDRTNPSAKDLVGNPRKVVILGLEPKSVQSSAPLQAGLIISNIIGNTIGSNEAVAFVINPNTAYTVISGRAILDPEHVVTAEMYEKMEAGTPAMLDAQVQILSNGHDEIGSLAANTVAHQTLLGHLSSPHDNDFKRVMLTEVQIADLFTTYGQNTGRQRIEIPKQLAVALKEDMQRPLIEAANRFVDMHSFSVKLVRMDGQKWSCTDGLVGVPFNTDIGADATARDSALLNQAFFTAVELEMEYVCVQDGQ